MRKITIDFINDWPGFDKETNEMSMLLRRYYDVEITNKPDIVFYSCFGDLSKLIQYDTSTKVYINGEPFIPDIRNFDFAFSYNTMNSDKIYRIPIYWWCPEHKGLPYKTIDSKNKDKYINRKFCNFIYGNPSCSYRNQFFDELCKYKKVDSLGLLKNNTGKYIQWESKIPTMSEYKFSLAMENSYLDGYTTEKIIHPMLANSIPVYWGNKDVGHDFDTNSFIVCNKDDMTSAIEKIIELDQNDDKYFDMLNRPWFTDYADELKDENIFPFIEKIVNNDKLSINIPYSNDKRNVKIDFVNFWNGFDKENDPIVKLLRTKYNVSIDENPDIVFYNHFSSGGDLAEPDNIKNLIKYDSSTKVLINGEPFKLNEKHFDFALSYESFGSDKVYKLPEFWWEELYDSLLSKSIQEEDKSKLLNRKFCNFIYTNPNCEYRNKIFEKLSKYKKIDSFGRHMNNTGIDLISNRESKISTQSQYKFSIAMENTSLPGYITEKIIHPMIANSMPIYWGDPQSNLYFNHESYIDCTNKTIDEVVDYIVYLDKDDDAYFNKMRNKWVIDKPKNLDSDNILKFLTSIVDFDNTKTLHNNEKISIHDLPSRSYYENNILPSLKTKTPILDIGIRKYGLDYKRKIGIEKDYYTCDIQLSTGVDSVDFLCDVSSRRFSSQIKERKLKFNCILFCGIMGVGINRIEQIEMTFMNFNNILNVGGIVVIGWPEYPKKFLYHEIGLEKYECDDISSKKIIPIIEKCKFRNCNLEGVDTYRGSGEWDKEKKFQAYMIFEKYEDIPQYQYMLYSSNYSMFIEKTLKKPLM